jgi:hypothetical protein
MMRTALDGTMAASLSAIYLGKISIKTIVYPKNSKSRLTSTHILPIIFEGVQAMKIATHGLELACLWRTFGVRQPRLLDGRPRRKVNLLDRH